MIWLISWFVYGLIVGAIAKGAMHAIAPQQEEPIGLLPTVSIGVVGSYLGGFLNYLLFGHGTPFSPSGIIMGIVGAILLLAIYGAIKASGGSDANSGGNGAV